MAQSHQLTWRERSGIRCDQLIHRDQSVGAIIFLLGAIMHQSVLLVAICCTWDTLYFIQLIDLLRYFSFILFHNFPF